MKLAQVQISIAKSVLESIIAECDGVTDVETGGRLLGTFGFNDGRLAEVVVTGVIDAGPRARRTRNSLFQDGRYQARVFRQVEEQHPDIEHLGNWHTHHVNGFPCLSGGDTATYRRHVNHRLHSSNFWYALLVVNGHGGERYGVQHYLLQRGDPAVYVVSPRNVRVVDSPAVWPLVEPASNPSPQLDHQSA